MVLENRDSSPVDKGGTDRMKTKKMIQSELLCFLCHKIDIMPDFLLVKVASEFYNEQEIREAKEIIFTHLATGERNIKRKGSDKNQQNVSDMIDIIHKADPEEIPLFGAFNLNKLPPLDMNSVDVVAMQKEIQMLKNTLPGESLRGELMQQIDLMRIQMTEMTDCVTAMGLQLTQLAQQQVKPSGSGSLASITAQAIMPSAPLNKWGTSRSNSECKSPLRPVTPFEGISPKVQRNTNIKQYSKPCDQSATGVKTKDSVPKATNATSSNRIINEARNDEDWKQAIRKRNRIRNAMVLGRSSAENTNLRSKGRFVSLFISRLEPDCESNELQAYIKSKFNIDLECTQLETKYASYASFKAEGYCKDPTVFYDPDMWPESILVRKYFKPRS